MFEKHATMSNKNGIEKDSIERSETISTKVEVAVVSVDQMNDNNFINNLSYLYYQPGKHCLIMDIVKISKTLNV